LKLAHLQTCSTESTLEICITSFFFVEISSRLISLVANQAISRLLTARSFGRNNCIIALKVRNPLLFEGLNLGITFPNFIEELVLVISQSRLKKAPELVCYDGERLDLSGVLKLLLNIILVQIRARDLFKHHRCRVD
jgi:hypothetical protein